MAKHRDRRAILGWPRKLGNLLLQGVVGYGYRPGRAAVWMLAVLAAGITRVLARY